MRRRSPPAGGRPRSGASRGSSTTSCKTADGVSPVLSAIDVVLSLGMFVVLYALLLVLFLYLLNRKIQDGPEELEDVETVAVSSLPDTFRDVFSRSRRAADLGDEP